MLDQIEKIFQFEAIAPMLGGAIVWFGANYAVIGPEVIAPRLAEKYYAPMCEHVVTSARGNYAQKEKALIDQFEKGIASQAESIRRQTQNAAGGFFSLFGDEGKAFWDYYGGSLSGGLATMTEAPLQSELAQARNSFYGKLEEQRATATATVKYDNPTEYCGCVISDAMNERFDVAAYSASLRFYVPPTIRNFESGAAYVQSAACGSMPII